MKLKNLLTTLVIIGAGALVMPAQADSQGYVAGSLDGLMIAKKGEDDRRVKRDEQRNSASLGASGGYVSDLMREHRQLNFKERLYIERKREREEAKAKEEAAKNQ